jgi:hypothetical protein
MRTKVVLSAISGPHEAGSVEEGTILEWSVSCLYQRLCSSMMRMLRLAPIGEYEKLLRHENTR